MSANILWWGYLHTNGTIQVKRYFDRRDLVEAIESPFVQTLTEPFEATGRKDAIEKAKSVFITEGFIE